MPTKVETRDVEFDSEHCKIDGTFVIGWCMLNISEPSTSRLRHLQALPQTITVQGRIRATGATVSHPRECDIPNRICLDSEKNGLWSTYVGLTFPADCPEITPEPGAGRLTFLEDFTLEHSLHGLRITLIELAGIF